MRFVFLPDGRVDAVSGAVSRTGTPPQQVRAKELALLCRLASEPRLPVAREALYEDVWGYHPGTRSRTLDSTVRSLRQAIEADPRRPCVVTTVAGVGYSYQPPERHDEARRALEQGVAKVALALDTHPLVVVHGPPGSGRTTWLRHVPAPPGLLPTWADVADDPEGAVIERALGLARTDQVVPVLQDTEPRLFLVDNVDTDELLERIASFAHAQPQHRWVVARRARPRGIPSVRVPPLEAAAAYALFVRTADLPVPPEPSDPGLAAILEHLGGSPGALVAVARAAHVGLHHLLEQLERGGLAEASETAGLAAAAMVGRAALSAPQRQLLDRLRGIRHPLPLALASRLGPATELGLLVDQGLATVDRDRRIAALAVCRRAPTAEDHDALARAVDHWAADALHPLAGPLDVASATVLDGLRAALQGSEAQPSPAVRLAALHVARRAGNPRLPDPILEKHHPAVWAWFVEGPRDARLEATRRCDDPCRRGATVAHLLRMDGDLEAACGGEPPVGASGVDVGLWCQELALAHRWASRYGDALRWAGRAVHELRAAPLPLARAQAVLADLRLITGNLTLAEQTYRHIVRSPDAESRLRGWLGLGELALLRRDAAAAISHVDEAQRLVRRVDVDAGTVSAVMLGLYLLELGRLPEARQMALLALQGAEVSAGLQVYGPRARRLLGSVALEDGRLEEARASFLAAAAATPPRERAQAAALVGVACELLGDEQGAMDSFRAAVPQLSATSQVQVVLGMLASVPLGMSDTWLQHARTLQQSTQEPALGEVAQALQAALLPQEDARSCLAALQRACFGCSFYGRLAVRLTAHRLGIHQPML